MPYSVTTLLSVIVFSLVHLFASKLQRLDKVTHGRFLSAGGGVAIAYVFIDLLPKLAKSDLIVRQALAQVFPFAYFERHVYIMALLGFLLFFAVGQSHYLLKKKAQFCLTISSYAFFNFLIGYAIVDKNNPEVQPLLLFTIAIGLHYFTNDFSLSEDHGKMYSKQGKWLLIASLFLGWLAGSLFTLSGMAIALVSAFIGGGVIMNVTRHELPKENPHSLGSFLLFSILYSILLLAVGS